MIHDQVDFLSPSKFILSTGHHTIHHSKFNYNYGQFFTLWDRIGGSFRNPSAYSGKAPIDKVNEILAMAHDLAGRTGSEVFLILTIEERLYSYATGRFKPLITEKDGKTLIVKCLWEKVSAKVEEMVKYRNPADVKEDPEKTVEMHDKDFESVPFIENEDERYEYLKSKFMELRDKFLKKTKPGNPKGEEGLLIVATEARQLLTMASPMLRPMIETREGKELVQTLMGQLVGITPQKVEKNS